MNRVHYFNCIERKLTFFAYTIEVRGGLNILDYHLHSENFYLHFFNLLFGWNLKNLNTVNQNAAAIDLIDENNRIIIQVSATATKRKIESALSKDLSGYSGYLFKFISISKGADELRSQAFSNPHGLSFSPANDIYDVKGILQAISSMDIDRQKEICEFLEKELTVDVGHGKMESNLTSVINILAKEDLNQSASNHKSTPFEIENKISFNQLDAARAVIDDYKIHYSRIDRIYADFDKQGANKSLSVLDSMRKEYLALIDSTSPDECFFFIIDKVAEKIRASANYESMPDEEIRLCVGILVVDAFVRCKVFKNPVI